MTNNGPYRIIKHLNDVNFIVQKMQNSSMEIVHIDRLTRFHRTVPKPWKQVLRKEQETASEKSASEDEACASAGNAEATHAKDAAGLPERATANANNGDMHTSDSNYEEMDANVTNTDSDMTVDLIDFTDGIVELADCDASDQTDTGDCFDVANDSGVELYNTSIDLPDSCMNGDTSRDPAAQDRIRPVRVHATSIQAWISEKRQCYNSAPAWSRVT